MNLKLNDMKTIKNALLLLLAFNFVVACSNSDDPEPVNEEEVITTLEVTLTPEGKSANVILKSVDLDGDGPNEPVLSITGNFTANTVYDGTMLILNETEIPAEDVTVEILEEDDEHQFFFSFTNDIATATYNDADEDGNPIGVQFKLTTGNAGTGNATFILKHEPNKNAEGVSEGNMANAGGSTDIEATFTITVQ